MPLFQSHASIERFKTTTDLPRTSKKLSFKELENRSKIFARILRETGCKEGAPVCCVMSNSIDFLIALWGIKYAGCKALPVDPTQPVNQIQSVILDSKAEWLIVDKRAKPLLDAGNLGQDSFNIAWMDSTKMVPDNCFPEFVRDNIDHISMRPVYPEPDKAEPVAIFHRFEETRLKKNTFTQEDVVKITSSILETINIHSDDRIAGLTSCNSPLVLLEIMSLSRCEASLFLFGSDQRYCAESFIREINELKITHLLLESEILKTYLPQIFAGNIISSSVDELLIWGKEPSKKMLEGLKKIFPNATIYNVSLDPDKNISIHIDDQSTSRFIRVANIPTRTDKRISL